MSHQEHDHSHFHYHTNEIKTRAVVLLMVITMIFEIGYGYATKSSALLAEGLHMFSHVLVLTLAWAAYFVARATANGENYKRQKLVITLSGFASAVVFLVMTVLMAYRSIRGFFEKDMEVMPAAIAVAIVGLVVNGLSAYLLHREEDKSDPNLKAAFMHVMSDMVLSVFAIVSLAVVQFWDVRWVDSALGLVAAMVFLYWAVRLLISSGRQIISAV